MDNYRIPFGGLHNLVNVLWLVLYYLFFSIAFGGGFAFLFFAVLYTITILWSLTIGEWFIRKKLNLREPMTRQETEKVIPIFQHVYACTKACYPAVANNIKLYISDDLDINAFALGCKSLVITRGSYELLNEQALCGIMAHEFGHFANLDCAATVIAQKANLPLRIITGAISGICLVAESISNSGVFGCVGGLFKLVLKAIEFLSDMLLFTVIRHREYKADEFAYLLGFGNELLSSLYLLNQLECEGRRSIADRLFSTHPPLKNRIASLEGLLYQQPML